MHTRSFKRIPIMITTILLFTLAMSLSASAQHEYAVSPTNPDVTVTMDDENSLIMHIRGSVKAPGNVIVEYSSEGLSPFVTAPVPTQGTNFSLEVMRLRPQTRYNFKVFLLESSNNPLLQHEGTFTTGPLPKGLKDAKFDLIQGKPTYDLIMVEMNIKDFKGIVAIDQVGRVVWYYQHDKQVFTFAQQANRNLVFNELSQVVGNTMTEIAPDGRIINSVDDILMNGSPCEPKGRWHHEMILRPENKVWTLGHEIRAINIDGKDRLQTGDTIEEWDLDTGTVTPLVSLFDIMDPAKDRTEASNATDGFFWWGSRDQYAGITEDWTHANSLDVLPDGKILMSLRHLNQIIAIKPDFSGIAWRLGGPASDFAFPNASDKFYHQHYARMLTDGHILLFDNGNFRPEEEGGEYSRGLELELDFNTMQAHKVWEYRNNPDLYSPAVCSAVRLANGNTVLDFGIANTSGIYTLVEADAAGKAVAILEISAPEKLIQYRAIPIDNINGERLKT